MENIYLANTDQDCDDLVELTLKQKIEHEITL